MMWCAWFLKKSWNSKQIIIINFFCAVCPPDKCSGWSTASSQPWRRWRASPGQRSKSTSWCLLGRIVTVLRVLAAISSGRYHFFVSVCAGSTLWSGLHSGATLLLHTRLRNRQSCKMHNFKEDFLLLGFSLVRLPNLLLWHGSRRIWLGFSRPSNDLSSKRCLTNNGLRTTF